MSEENILCEVGGGSTKTLLVRRRQENLSEIWIEFIELQRNLHVNTTAEMIEKLKQNICLHGVGSLCPFEKRDTRAAGNLANSTAL